MFNVDIHRHLNKCNLLIGSIRMHINSMHSTSVDEQIALIALMLNVDINQCNIFFAFSQRCRKIFLKTFGWCMFFQDKK